MLDLDPDENEMESAMETYKAKLEAQFNAGAVRHTRRVMVRPRPDDWDSDMEGGHWEDQPGVWGVEPAGRTRQARDEDESMSETPAPRRPAKRTTTTTAKPATKPRAAAKPAARKPAAKATPKAPARRGRKPATAFVGESEEEEDVIMDDDDDEGAASPPTRVQPRRGAAAKSSKKGLSQGQSTLNFSQSQRSATQRSREPQVLEMSDDQISDEFESRPSRRR